MNIEIEEIRQLLQARKIEEALQLLAARFKSTENQKDVDLLISRFNEGKRKETLGISGREDTTIAENKLIHDILGFIESPETFKQVRNYKRYQFFGVSFVMIAMIILIIVTFGGSIKRWNKDKSPYFNIDFPISGSKFSILILPFNEYCRDGNGIVDVGMALNRRFNLIATKDSLDIFSYYCEDCPIGVNFNSDSAMALISRSNYDLIIFGEQIDKTCNTNDLSKVCINYAVNSLSLQEKKIHISDQFTPFTFDGLLNGELQGEIDFIIYKTVGILEKFGGNSIKAFNAYYHIFDSLEIKNEEILDELIILCLYNLEFDLALNILNHYEEEREDLSPEELLLVTSLKIAIYSKNGQREQLIKSVELLSFIKEYFNIKESTYLGRRFHKAGEFLSPHNPDRAIELIDEALNIFNKKNVASEIPKCYHDMALAYYYKSAFGQAVSLLNKAIVLYQDQEFDNKWLIVRAYQLQGECEIRRKNFGIGEKLIRKSIAQIEKMEYPQEVGVVQVGTAREYSLIGENQKVIRWLKRANTTFANVDNNKYTIAIRANVQKDIGISYVNLKEYQQAEKWLRNS